MGQHPVPVCIECWEGKIHNVWANEAKCHHCQLNFGYFKRRHHCRNCGLSFCSAHSSNTMVLEQFGSRPVRVCDGCMIHYGGRGGFNLHDGGLGVGNDDRSHPDSANDGEIEILVDRGSMSGFTTNVQRRSMWLSFLPLTTGRQYEKLLVKAKINIPHKYNLIKRDTNRTTFARTTDIYSYTGKQIVSRIGDCRHGYDDIEQARMYQKMLERILVAYAVYDPNVGYCEGMTNIVALIMSSNGFNEIQAFYVLVSLMENKNYNMKDVFRPGLEGTKLRLYQLEHLMKWYLPDIQNHLEQHSIAPNFWATSWIMTLFSNDMSLHPNLACRFLDVFISNGWNGIFSIMLAVIAVNKNHIMGQSMNHILQKMNRITKNMSLNQFEAIYTIATSINVAPRQLEHLEINYFKNKS
jgi:Rab-GTPase-TBC domain/FYVE zinc finger